MSGLVKRKFFHRFTSDDTYTIPTGVTMLWIECIGAGGGGGGSNASGGEASGGGGGGAMSWGVFNASDLSDTLNVDVGVGGIGGVNTAQTSGDPGTDSLVALIGNNNAGTDSGKLLVKAFGGAGGRGSWAVGGGGGGGGGRGGPPRDKNFYSHYFDHYFKGLEFGRNFVG